MMAITMAGRPAMAQDAPTVVQQLDSTHDDDVIQTPNLIGAPVSRAKVDSASSGKNAAFAAGSSPDLPLFGDPPGGGRATGAESCSRRR